MENQSHKIHQLFSKYRRGHKLEQISKINRKTETKSDEQERRGFHFDSGDIYIRKILANNQWKLVSSESINNELKWICQPKFNTFSELGLKQKINHFPHTHNLTTKLGLKKILAGEKSGFIQQSGKNHTNFFPRSYDLSQENEVFVADFKRTAVLNLLKKIMIAIQLESQDHFVVFSNHVMNRKNNKQINWLQEFKEMLDYDELFERDEQALKRSQLRVNGKIFQSLLFYFAIVFTLDCEITEAQFPKIELQEMVAYSAFNPPFRCMQKHYWNDKNLVSLPTIKALSLFFKIYKQCFQYYPWFKSDGLRNIWVIKTSDSSRGRSVFLAQTLQQIKSYNNGMRMVQKYIENVWIHRQSPPQVQQQYPFMSKLQYKKFDIRMWVLVTSFCPLQAYIYEEGYLRISQEQYQLLNIGSEKTHLTNFSVNWKTHKQDGQNSYLLLSDFFSYLDNNIQKDSVSLKKEMDKIVLTCLQSAEMTVKSHDSRCFELFGFDIILDGELKPWLLQINMSPACKERGKLVTILQEMGSGLLSLVGLIDKNQHQSKWLPLTTSVQPNTNNKTGKSKSKLYSKMNSKQNLKQHFKSQCFIKPNSKQFSSLNSNEESEILKPFRINSILPAIANSFSFHRTQNIQGIKIAGQKLTAKELYNADHYVDICTAAVVIQKISRNLKKEKQLIDNKNNIQIKKKNIVNMNWLKLYETLAKLAKKRKIKVFKRIKKLFRKKISIK